MKTQFRVKDALIYAINAVFDDPWFFVKFFLVWIGLSVATILFAGFAYFMMGRQVLYFPNLLTFIAAAFLSVLVFLLLYYISWYYPIRTFLDFYDGNRRLMNTTEIIQSFSVATILRLIIASFFIWLLIIIGLILLVIPGLYFATRSQFTFLHIVDRNIGFIHALKLSFEQTKTNFWRFFWLALIEIILTHTVVLIPIALLTQIYAYRKTPIHEAEKFLG